jgi:hypothetical protein
VVSAGGLHRRLLNCAAFGLGRAWGGTCAGPLHVVVAEPELTSNVHGLKVRHVTFQFGKWCGRAQKCVFFCTCSDGPGLFF